MDDLYVYLIIYIYCTLYSYGMLWDVFLEDEDSRDWI